MSEHYILEGKVPVPCDDVHVLTEWWSNDDNRRVGYAHFGPITVSTVFLMLDHNHDGTTPLLFETLVQGWDGDNMERYTTWEQAEYGHAKWVQRVQAYLSASKVLSA